MRSVMPTVEGAVSSSGDAPGDQKRGSRGSRGKRRGVFAHDPALQRLFNDLVLEEWAISCRELRGKALEADFIRRKQAVYHRLCRRVPGTVQRSRQHRGLAQVVSGILIYPSLSQAVLVWRFLMAGDVPYALRRQLQARLGILGLGWSPNFFRHHLIDSLATQAALK